MTKYGEGNQHRHITANIIAVQGIMRSRPLKAVLSTVLADPRATLEGLTAAVAVLYPALIEEDIEVSISVVDPLPLGESFETGRAGESGSPVDEVAGLEAVVREPDLEIAVGPSKEAVNPVLSTVEAVNIEDGPPADTSTVDAVVLPNPMFI